MNRRQFLGYGSKVGLTAATASLWANPLSRKAFADMSGSPYRALVAISMPGGNDGNNTIVPVDPAEYSHYASIRGALALPAASLNVLQSSGGPNYGLHPALKNVANLYNAGKAAIIANSGPLTAPVTKALLLDNQAAYPDSLYSHPDAGHQWESATAYDNALTGWGGRIADFFASQGGSLPPMLNLSLQSWFTVGETVQAVAVQSGDNFLPLSPDLQGAVDAIASSDLNSKNLLVQQAAVIRKSSLRQQNILNQAAAYRPLSTVFPTDTFGSSMRSVAQVLAGRSVIGASRQIFYIQQGSYDTHSGQLQLHAANLQSLDAGLGAFFQALDELGLTDQVLVVTQSEFNRTYTPNVNAGSDHAWGNHQLILGGGLKGGRILGTMPSFDLNGPDDLNGLGIWVPTTSVPQIVGSVGSWMGLSSTQVASVCPELSRFPSGAIKIN